MVVHTVGTSEGVTSRPMEHMQLAEIAALLGALGAVSVLVPRGGIFPLIGFVLLGAATGGLGWALVGDDDVELLLGDPTGIALVAVGVAAAIAGAVPLARYPAAVPVALLAVAPFRVPVQVGDEEAFLLLPLYLVIAASVVAGLSVGLVLLVSAPRASIAREVVDHIMHEPGTTNLVVPVAPGALAGVLDPDGTRLRPGLGDVTFAARCVHDGHVVPHLVVRMPEGAVTVLLLRHREIDEPVQIAEQGLVGVVLPAPRGSIAIVGQGLKDPDGIAQKVFEAVDWGV